MKTLTRNPVVWPVSALRLSGRFKQYKPEEECVVRKAEVKQDKAMEELKELFRKTEGPVKEPSITYARMTNLLKNHNYSAKDIENFSITIAEFHEDGDFSKKAGLFLSALINNGKDKDYVIHAKHMCIELLGYENTKNLVVEGNLIGIGWKMSRGKFILRGNTGAFGGWGMTGGEIHVYGPVGPGQDLISSLELVIRGKIYYNEKVVVYKDPLWHKFCDLVAATLQFVKTWFSTSGI